MTTTKVEFDPFSDEYFDDPTEVYRRLRDEAPVYFSEKYGFYALSRFADVVSAHRDLEAFTSTHGIELMTLTTKTPEEVATYRQIIMMDPPEHDVMRALVSRVFTPRAMVALEPMIREVIAGFLDDLDDPTDFDAVADFSALFPVEVISRMLGVPDGERQQIRHWLDASLHREAGQTEPSAENDESIMAMGMYFYELAVEKRKNPADDMLSRLAQVTVDRGDGTQTGLDDAEIAGFATLIGGAGAETVTKLIGNAVVLFARQPRPVAEGARRSRARSPARSRRSSATTRRRSTRVGSRSPRATSTAAPSPRASRCCCSPAPPPATRGRSSGPTTSTSSGRRTSPSASATACTAASAPRWPGPRAASPSTSWPRGTRTSRSTRPASAGCTCRTWPATRTCRSAPAPDHPASRTCQSDDLSEVVPLTGSRVVGQTLTGTFMIDARLPPMMAAMSPSDRPAGRWST